MNNYIGLSTGNIIYLTEGIKQLLNNLKRVIPIGIN